MTNEEKNQVAKEAVKDQIASILGHIERHISTMADKMNGNYLHFFEWEAEKMFKAHKRRAFFTKLTRAVEVLGEDVNLSEWLLAMVHRKINDIARGSLTRNSTSQMANHAHLLNLEAEQEIIRELERLAHVAEYYSK